MSNKISMRNLRPEIHADRLVVTAEFDLDHRKPLGYQIFRALEMMVTDLRQKFGKTLGIKLPNEPIQIQIRIVRAVPRPKDAEHHL